MRKIIILAIVITSCTLTAIIVHLVDKTKLPSKPTEDKAVTENEIKPAINKIKEEPSKPSPGKKPVRQSEDYSGALNNLKCEVRTKFNAIKRDTGTGFFTGQVLTSSDEPLQDVTVKAGKIDTNPYGYGYYRNWKKQGVEEKIENFVKSLEKSEVNSYETKTDANGKFNLDNLPVGKYTVRAIAEGYVVRDTKNQYNFDTNAEILFQAKKLLQVKVEVLMPDGSVAPSAFINIGYQAYYGQNIQSMQWTPENNIIDLNNYLDNAAGGIILSAKTQDDELFSEDCKISTEKIPDLVTFRLKTFPGIKGKIILEDNVLQDSHNQSFSVFTILNKKGREASIEYIQQGRELSTGTYNNNKYIFSKLIPGKYLIGCVFKEQLFSAEVTVTDKMEEKDIKVTVPAISDFLTVRVSDAKGKPLKDCGFSAVYMKKVGNFEFPNNINIQPFSSKDGSYLIPYKNFGDDLLNSNGQEITITVRSNSCGEKTFSLTTPLPKEVNVKYEEQGFLTLCMTNFGTQGYEDRINAELKQVDSKNRDNNFRSHGNQNQGMSLKGELELGPVQPGQYNLTVSLKTNRWQFIEILRSPVTIKPGENRHTVVLPELYSLKVNAGKGNAGKNVSLMKEDAKNEQISLKFNNDGFIEFYDLPAGNYTLSIESDKEKLSIPETTVIQYE